MNLSTAATCLPLPSVRPSTGSPAIPARPTPADLQRILEAGLEAPLAGRRHGWRFAVTCDAEHSCRILDAAGVAASGESEAVIAVVALEAPWRRRAERLLREAGRHRDFATAAVRSGSLAVWLDAQARIATDAMARAARAGGWRARVHTHLDAPVLRRALHFPPAVAFVALVTIGSWPGQHRVERGWSVAAR